MKVHKVRQQQWALEDFEEDRRQIVLAQRLDQAAVFTAQVGMNVTMLSREEEALYDDCPSAARRFTHLIDTYTVRAGQVVGAYVVGEL